MAFLTEMFCQLKRRQLQLRTQCDGVPPPLVLLTVLLKCCEDCVQPPVRSLSEVSEIPYILRIPSHICWLLLIIYTTVVFADWMFILRPDLHRTWLGIASRRAIGRIIGVRPGCFPEFECVRTGDPSHSASAYRVTGIPLAAARQHCLVLLSVLQVRMSMLPEKRVTTMGKAVCIFFGVNFRPRWNVEAEVAGDGIKLCHVVDPSISSSRTRESFYAESSTTTQFYRGGSRTTDRFRKVGFWGKPRTRASHQLYCCCLIQWRRFSIY